jgi:hypothetical protein
VKSWPLVAAGVFLLLLLAWRWWSPTPKPVPTVTAPVAAPSPVDAPAAPPSPSPSASPLPRAHPATEAELMARLRSEVDVHPETALALVRTLEARHPNGAMADERAYLQMRALVHLGRIAEARNAAEAFYARFPHSPFGEKVFQLTGFHPRPPPGPRAP